DTLGRRRSTAPSACSCRAAQAARRSCTDRCCSAIPACAGGCRIDLGAHARVHFHQQLESAFLLPDPIALDPASDPGREAATRLGGPGAFVAANALETPVGGNKRVHDRFLESVKSLR